MKSKKYYFTWEDFDSSEVEANGKTLIENVLNDPELPELEEIIFGCWGEAWDEDAQSIIDGLVENKDKIAHIKSLFVGDMEYDECEVSWIVQGNYSKLWEALPNLEVLTIKGSSELTLGDIKHDKLKELKIISGGLGKDVIESISKASLPALETLNLYLGVENYGFDGDIDDIKGLLNSNLPSLKFLGLGDSEIQDEVAQAVAESKYMDQVECLDFSNGTLTDKGGEVLLNEIPKHSNIKALIIEYHFLSDKMIDKLEKLPIEVNISDQQEADEYDGEEWYYPMLTE